MSILAQPSGSDGPLIATEGVDDPVYVCGSCGAPIIVGAEPGSIQGMVLRCGCGAYNDGSI